MGTVEIELSEYAGLKALLDKISGGHVLDVMNDDVRVAVVQALARIGRCINVEAA